MINNNGIMKYFIYYNENVMIKDVSQRLLKSENYHISKIEELNEIKLNFKNLGDNYKIMANHNAILLQTSDKTLYYLPNGMNEKEISEKNAKWKREEGLAFINEVEILDVKSKENNDYIIPSFTTRLIDQFYYLINSSKEIGKWIISGFKISKESKEENDLYFGFKKNIICLSEFNVMYLISSDDGSVIYKKEFEGKCHLIKENNNDIDIICEEKDDVILYNFDPSSKDLKRKIIKENVKINKMIKIPTNPITYGFICDDSTIELYPKNDDLHYYYADIDNSTKIISGYYIKSSNIKPLKLYEISLSDDEEEVIYDYKVINYEDIIQRSGISDNGPIIMKYLDKNLLTVLLYNKKTSIATINIIEMVNGHIIHSQKLTNCNIPFGLEVIENWVILSFWNSIDSRTDILSLSLTKDEINKNEISWMKMPKNLDKFSSYDNINITIDYKLFNYRMGIKKISRAITEEGISNKYLIFLLNNDDIMKIDRKLLDPLGKDRKLSAKEVDDGLTRYNPIVMMNPHWILNENQQVYGIKDFKSSPARLESTSILVGYGNDLLYVHVQPEKPFDMLPNDFNYKFLLLSIICLTILTYILYLKNYDKAMKMKWL